MTTARKAQPVEISVDCRAATIYVASKRNPTPETALWVWDSTGTVESHDPMDRVGGPYHITDFVPSEGDRWFLFVVADCAFPCRDLVRGTSWEDAYETYLDWAATNRHIAIDPCEEADYGIDTDNPTCQFTSDGTPVDTDNVQGDEMQLYRIDCVQ